MSQSLSFSRGRRDFIFDLHGELLGFAGGATVGAKGLLGERDGFLGFVEEDDLEFIALHGDFAVHSFVFAKLKDAPAAGAKFHAAVRDQRENVCFNVLFCGEKIMGAERGDPASRAMPSPAR